MTITRIKAIFSEHIFEIHPVLAGQIALLAEIVKVNFEFIPPERDETTLALGLDADDIVVAVARASFADLEALCPGQGHRASKKVLIRWHTCLQKICKPVGRLGFSLPALEGSFSLVA